MTTQNTFHLFISFINAAAYIFKIQKCLTPEKLNVPFQQQHPPQNFNTHLFRETYRTTIHGVQRDLAKQQQQTSANLSGSKPYFVVKQQGKPASGNVLKIG